METDLSAPADAMAEAKHPAGIIAGRYGHPVHGPLVAVPIGSWVAASVFDIASHVVSTPEPLAEGARWLLAIGVVGAVVAAGAGFIDLFRLPPGTRVFRTALLHMSLALTVTALFAVSFLLRLDLTAPVPLPPLILSLVSLAVLVAVGYLGGTLAYRYGVRVVDEATQAEGYRPLHPRPSDDRPHRTGSPVAD